MEGRVERRLDGGNIPSRKYQPAKTFYDAYVKRWKEMQCGHKPAVDYDAVYAMKMAIEKAGSLDPDKNAKELENLSMVGCTGRIHFADRQYVLGVDSTSMPSLPYISGEKVRGSVIPDSIAEGTIEKPESMKSASR